MRRLVRLVVWLLGEEGDVVADARTQVMALSASGLVTGTVLVSPLVSELAGVFAVSESAAGLLMIPMAAPQPFLVPVMGVVADRVGRRPVFLAGLLLFRLSGGAIALTTSFRGVLLCRFLQGIGFSAAMPMTIILFGDLYNGSRETTAQGVRMVGINGVYIILPFLAGLLFISSWRYPFLLYLGAVPLAASAWFVLPATAPDERSSFRAYLHRLVGFIRVPAVALYLASFALRFVILFGFMTYVSVLATDRLGLAVTLVGTVVMVKGGASLLGATQGGRLVDAANPSYIVAAGFTLAGLGMAAMGIVDSLGGLFLATAAFGLGDGVVSPAQKSTINQIVPARLRCGSMSVAVAFQNLGKVVGPSLFGLGLFVFDPGATFLAFGVFGGGTGVALVLSAYAFVD
jgi:predicted MFS family arabinose efflux permease